MTATAASSPAEAGCRYPSQVWGRQGGGRPRRRARLDHDSRSAVGFLSFNLAGFVLFTLVPVGLCVYISLFNWPLTGGHTKFVGLGNFSTALSSYGFWRIVLNTLYFVGAVHDTQPHRVAGPGRRPQPTGQGSERQGLPAGSFLPPRGDPAGRQFAGLVAHVQPGWDYQLGARAFSGYRRSRG